MSKSIYVFLIAVCIPAIIFAEGGITEIDNTVNWSFPFKASSERENTILQKGISIQTPISYDELVNLIGAADLVTDLHKGHFGLSPSEDGFMMANRSKLTYRAIWYIEKKGTSPNLNDKWLGAYIGLDNKTVLKIMKNGI